MLNEIGYFSKYAYFCERIIYIRISILTNKLRFKCIIEKIVLNFNLRYTHIFVSDRVRYDYKYINTMY